MIKFKELLEGVFDEGTEEFDIIQECYDLITKTAPSVSSEAKTHMILLDHSRTKAATLYYLINREISKKKEIFRSTYDAQYTRLVKLGRPSNTAIESEIRASYPEYAGAMKQIETLEQVKELVSSYLRCIDASKQTAIEVLRDSRRLD